MGGGFNTNYREEKLISRLENSRKSDWDRQLFQLGEHGNRLARRLAMKLIDASIIETTNQEDIKKELFRKLSELFHVEDFDLQYVISPLRNLVSNPNKISLYLTVFVVEKLINHRSVVDIYGTDEEIYNVVNKEVNIFLQN